jgi:hypothetical protein
VYLTSVAHELDPESPSILAPRRIRGATEANGFVVRIYLSVAGRIEKQVFLDFASLPASASLHFNRAAGAQDVGWLRVIRRKKK